MSSKTDSNCAVVIPIYKENISNDEEKSLRRCLDVLDEYPIIFIAPHKLNYEKYKHICSEYKSSVSYELFQNKFFSGFNGYNALMVNSEFYKRFLKYKYILIYQLDVFVFENALAFWCEQDYDYIGGPYYELRRGASAPTHTNFLNGGLSLRKTETFYRLAKAKLRLDMFFYLSLSRYDAHLAKRGTFSLIKLVFFYAGIKFLSKIFTLDVGEDFVWSEVIRKYGKIAPFDIALQFSFDSCPEYAYELSGCRLPFGCHGWTAYYNRLFWERHISLAMLKKTEANL